MNIKGVVVSLVISLVIGGIMLLICMNTQKKIAVIDVVKVFNEFNMKKELEADAKIQLQAISKQIDSISNKLRIAEATKNKEEVEKLSYTIKYMNSVLEKEYAQSNDDINTKVWKRLNPIIDQFGKNKGYHLIVGANGMGSVVYMDGYYDVTDEVLKFVNKKYEEGN